MVSIKSICPAPRRARERILSRIPRAHAYVDRGYLSYWLLLYSFDNIIRSFIGEWCKQ